MRSTRNQPFCWQEKKILRFLRKKYKGVELVKMKLLYSTITEMDSDFNGKDIQFYTKTISTYSGLSIEWIPTGLKNLEKHKIITIARLRDNGRFSKNYLVFTPENIQEQIDVELIEITPQEKLTRNMSNAVYRVLKQNKGGQSWQDLVGYSAEELKQHLQKQFKEGMTWENYGQWHVDHIVPIRSFTYDKPTDTDFLECWSIENLQPLWGAENSSKGCKVNGKPVNGKPVNGEPVNGEPVIDKTGILEDSILLEDSIYKEDNKKASQSSATYSLKEKTLKEFRNQRRVESGRQPMTPRQMTDKQKNSLDAFKTGIDYFKRVGYEEHGMLFMEVNNEKRNKVVRKLVISAYKNIGELNDLIDWWFSGNGEWADYEPEQCFSTRTIEKFKNREKKGGGKRYE